MNSDNERFADGFIQTGILRSFIAIDNLEDNGKFYENTFLLNGRCGHDRYLTVDDQFCL